MTHHRTVTFVLMVPPNGPGDIAGFPAAKAQLLVDRGQAYFSDVELKPEPAVDFDALTRAELVQHAASVLGFEGEPPDDVSDGDLRTALKAHAKGMPVPPPPAPPAPPPTLDQLDALDRVHLELFATTKAGMTDIDPALSDDDLRAQIRAVAESATSFVGTPSAARKAGKGR